MEYVKERMFHVYGKETLFSPYQNLTVLGSIEEKEENKLNAVIGQRDVLEKDAKLQRKLVNLQEIILIEKFIITVDGEKLENIQREDFVVKDSKFVEQTTNVTQRDQNVLSKDQFTQENSLLNVIGKKLD